MLKEKGRGQKAEGLKQKAKGRGQNVQFIKGAGNAERKTLIVEHLQKLQMPKAECGTPNVLCSYAPDFRTCLQ